MKKIALLFSLLISGCYLKSYPVTADVTSPSTYIAYTDSSQGTAWVVAPGYAVTAGHLCADATGSNPVWLKSPSGNFIPSKPIYFEVSPGPEGDLCILKTESYLQRPLIIADKEPAKGAMVGLIGYPHGTYISSSGPYIGNFEQETPSGHGASGGPIFYERGVYTIVIEGCARDIFDTSCTAGPSLTELKRALDEEQVPYTTTPEDPPEFPAPERE